MNGGLGGAFVGGGLGSTVVQTGGVGVVGGFGTALVGGVGTALIA